MKKENEYVIGQKYESKNTWFHNGVYEVTDVSCYKVIGGIIVGTITYKAISGDFKHKTGSFHLNSHICKNSILINP